jgi:hypothetical protein
MHGWEILTATAVAGLFFYLQPSIPCNSTNRRHLKRVINAQTQSSTLYLSIARTPGTGLSG